jgi:hypothetical protein
VVGAVLAEGGPLTIHACTITGNSATTSSGDAGGAVNSEGGAVDVETSSLNATPLPQPRATPVVASSLKAGSSP